MQDRIINHFHRSIEAKMACGEALAPLLVNAAESVVEKLLGGKKVFTCGNGFGHSLADIFTQCLLLKYQLERPAFPAILLGSQAGLATGVLQQIGPTGLFSHQLNSLGGEGDLLVTISMGDNPSNLIKAIQSAHDRNMMVIALGTDDDSDITAMLTGNDLQLMVPHTEAPRITEIQLLCLFSLCDLIDYQLFGGTA